MTPKTSSRGGGPGLWAWQTQLTLREQRPLSLHPEGELFLQREDSLTQLAWPVAGTCLYHPPHLTCCCVRESRRSNVRRPLGYRTHPAHCTVHSATQMLALRGQSPASRSSLLSTHPLEGGHQTLDGSASSEPACVCVCVYRAAYLQWVALCDIVYGSIRIM